MRSESAIRADYYKSTSGEFEARLLVKEKGRDSGGYHPVRP